MDADVGDALDNCGRGGEGEARLAKLALSQELRDLEWTGAVGTGVARACEQALLALQVPRAAAAKDAAQTISSVLGYPEFEQDDALVRKVFGSAVAVAALARLECFGNADDEAQQEQQLQKEQARGSSSTQGSRKSAPLPITQALIHCVHRCYQAGNEPERATLRQALGRLFARAVSATCGHDASRQGSGGNKSLFYPSDERLMQGVALALRVVRAVAAGFLADPTLGREDRALFLELVLPLHGVRGKRSPSEALLDVIHRDLTLCVLEFTSKDSALLVPSIRSLLECWPTNWDGNSPKQVLLLHELEGLLGSRAAKELRERNKLGNFELGGVVAKLAECIASDNSSVCERALLFWRNNGAIDAMVPPNETGERACKVLAPPLLSNALSHWNKTVTGMAATVLQDLLNRFKNIVVKAAIAAFPDKPPDSMFDYLTTVVDSMSPKISKPKKRSKKGKDTVEQAGAVEGDDNKKSGDGEDDEGEGGGEEEGAHDETKALVPRKVDASFMNMILGEELGDGSFSKVYRAFKVVRGKPRSEWGQFALKRMNEQHRDIATREASMMDRLAHPNCTRLVGMYESLGSVNLVLELAALGDLHSVAVAAGGCLDADAVRFASAEVATGLQALHDAGLVFGDLKPENVLVHANGHCKLGDFGATREAKAMRKGEAPLEGTLCYLAPELFQRTKLPGDDSGSKCSVIHSPAAVDWWAFGCMVFHLLAGRPPLWAEEEQDMVKSLVGFKVERYPDGFPPRAQVLVDALLHHDPRDRLASRDGALELDSHEFFRALGFPVGEAHAHKAPEFVKGQVRPQQGPWTQRTYSMIVAPLPQSYVGRGSAQSGLPAVQETEQERHKPWVDPDPGKGLRPAAMIATDASPHPAQAQAQTSGLSVPAAVFPKVMGSNSSFNSHTAMPGSRRSPAGKGGKYSVKGLDLTAG